jgi:hypothetical protein
MKEWWDEADVPALLEVAGRDTAENASRSLPILRAIGAIRDVVVVTSPWHFRAPYFFAPYRSYDMTPVFRPAPSLVGWKATWRELAHSRHVRARRRHAFAEVSLPAETELSGG